MTGPAPHYDVIDFVSVAKRRDGPHYDVTDFVSVAKWRGRAA